MAKKKNVSKKRSASKRQEIVVRVETAPVYPTVADLSEPITGAGKKLAIQKTWLGNNQILQMVQKTPQQYIYTRPGKGGGKFSYVTGSYVTKMLNFVFGWNWDFDVVEQGREGGVVWVKGKLTVRNADGRQQIVKTQFGRAEIKFMRGSKEMLDYGNDLKAATTDALKKCASMLGIASDVFSKFEYKDESGNDAHDQTPPPPKLPGAKPGPDRDLVYTCEDCDRIISEAEAGFSLKVFKKRLCRDCQKNKKK